MSQHWTEYWAAGRLTSLPNDFAGNYDGEIAEFWAAEFAGVPQGGRVLDVCTGNGAIALLAAGYFAGAGRDAGITAVDAAGIDPESIAKRHPDLASEVARIEFIGSAPVESLALPSEAFDLVTSQYGIEYCDRGPAAEQVARVLRPGGRLALICHAASSDIVRTMEAEARDYARLESLGFVAGIRRFLSGTLSFSRLHKLFESVGKQVVAEYRVSRSPLFAFVLQMLESAGRMDEARLRGHRLHLAGFARQLEMGEARLADMLRVNRAIHEDPEWYRVFEAHGLALLDSREILYQGRHRSGQACRFDKPI
jgi:SAM-dependent methyltransferase